MEKKSFNRLINSPQSEMFPWTVHPRPLPSWFVLISERLEKVLDFLCAQTASENRKVPQDVSAMAFGVWCLRWKVLSDTLEISVLRLDKEVVKLRGLYLIENTM